MKIAFERWNIAIWSETALNFRQNRGNGCILRAAGPISTIKQACIILVAWNHANITLNRRSISNRREITISFRQNRVNAYDLRAVVLVSTLKTTCTTLGMLNAMKIAFKRRNMAIWSESALNFRQNRVNGCILRAAGPISTMKQACIALVA